MAAGARADAVRVGIVGAGWAANEHSKTLARLDGVTIAGFADPDVMRAKELAARYGATHHATAGSLIAAEALDAVVVATPPGAHREAAVEAIEAGLAVFLEKPISRSLEDATLIAAAAEAARTVCAVGYQWRAISALDSLAAVLEDDGVRQIVSEGIGITQARSWFSNAALSGGLISERGSHHIDLQRAVGGEIVSVQAAGSRLVTQGLGHASDLATGTETGVAMTLHFASGALGIVHVLWVPETYPSRHRLTVFGSTSMYELDLDPVFSLRRDSGKPVLPDPAGEHPFAIGLIRFVDAARRHDPAGVICSPREAASTLAVVVACEHALVSGDTVPVEPLTGIAG